MNHSRSEKRLAVTRAPLPYRRVKYGRGACATVIMEPLEGRWLLSASPLFDPAVDQVQGSMIAQTAPLVPIGQQPKGTLSGKIVYTSAGHGWQWNNTLNRWATDRPNLNSMVEDFGNQDQMTFYADYLLRAGATVVPMRPVGRQVNELVLDNNSPGVTWSGSWSNNTVGPRWYDANYSANATVKYRFANANSSTETAVATYTPNIPESGFYPVYTWVAFGGNRTDQLYKINHTGGQMQITVDHRMVGNGWVYLGTYHFNAGSSVTHGSVQISNYSTGGGSVVIADSIRFGNGMGDVRWGSGGIGTGNVSGHSREDENSLLWLWRGVGQSTTFSSPSSVIGTSNVSAPARMAEHMNANTNPFGTSVYIGFHSNAANTTARGAIGLMTTDPGLRTPNQQALATYTGRQINVDMRALDGQFEHNWSTRTSYVGSNQNFGEINKNRFTNSSGVVEMDATIVEVAFHDNVQDAELMRDPRVRDQLARSTYEATLEYFINFGGAANITLPSAPRDVHVVGNASGEVTVSWNAGPSSTGGVNGVHGSAATGYYIFTSIDGYGFDGGTFVAGGGTTTAVLSGLDPDVPYYFKVAAVNDGGLSHGSEVITALPNGGHKQVLIVNGFDRHDRHQNFRQPYAFGGGGLTDRVWSRYNNSFDYVVQVHSAIHAAAPGTSVASTSNEAVINGAVNLADYHTVIWILGAESTVDETFDSVEQMKVEQFIAGGGNLFVTGSEIGWDLDAQNNGRSFFRNTLKGTYVADSANTYTVTPTGGGIFAGLGSMTFSSGSQFSNLTTQMYNVRWPDVISPQPGAQTAMSYVGGTGGGAAIQHQGTGGRGSVVMFGFPFEAINSTAQRAMIMERVLNFFGTTQPPEVILESFDRSSAPHAVHVMFNMDVSGNLAVGDLELVNLTTGQTISSALMSLSYDGPSNTATWTMSGLANGVLPDGNYEARLTASGITGPGGQEMEEDHVFSFFYLAGDANGDGQVTIADLGILAANWQQNLYGPANGDFNYDGVVSIADLGILAGNWQVDLTAGMALELEAVTAETVAVVDKVAAEPGVVEGKVKVNEDKAKEKSGAKAGKVGPGRLVESRSRGVFSHVPVHRGTVMSSLTSAGVVEELLDEESTHDKLRR